MPGKITPSKRKRMLALHRDGTTDTKLMETFTISDRRTLKKHLALAEHEEKQRQAGIKIIEDAQAKHLDEIRELIERWRKRIAVPPLGWDPVWLAADSQEMRKIEHDPLFEGVKEHLPFETLWTDYDTWKQKRKEYLAIGLTSPEEINPKAKTKRRHSKDTCQQSEPTNTFETLCEEICELQDRIRKQLQESLLCRDYIFHRCKFCPKQKLSR
jgi:hypothetical protein